MSIFTIEKLDEGFIVNELTDFTSKRIALGENTEEEILRKVAFFLTREIGISVSLNRRKANQTEQKKL